jgi:hypothetical protein
VERAIKYLKNQEKTWKKIRKKFGYNNNRIAKRNRRKDTQRDRKVENRKEKP